MGFVTCQRFRAGATVYKQDEAEHPKTSNIVAATPICSFFTNDNLNLQARRSFAFKYFKTIVC